MTHRSVPPRGAACAGTPVLRATGLTAHRGDVMLWSDLDLVVDEGKALAVTGPSGSGKSTLLHHLGLLAPVQAGRLEVDGRDVTAASDRVRRRFWRGTIGHLFQDHGLVPDWSVRRNLGMAFIGTRRRAAERADLGDAALRHVGLEGLASRPAHSLSGGEQQRVALARLLVRRPLLVVADEPTAALDDDNARAILSLLDGVRAAGTALVIATHDDRVVDWCDSHLDVRRAPPARRVV